jgi:hypothetical protein
MTRNVTVPAGAVDNCAPYDVAKAPSSALWALSRTGCRSTDGSIVHRSRRRFKDRLVYKETSNMRMIFVNLPVKDLDASKEFFSKLGFTYNDDLTDETAACMVVKENIFYSADAPGRGVNSDFLDTANLVQSGMK